MSMRYTILVSLLQNPCIKGGVMSYLYDLRTNDLVAPLGIACEGIVFSWKVQEEERGWMQSAYEIVVSCEGGSVWESGKILSDKSVGIVLETVVEPCTAYSWTVNVWSKQGEVISHHSKFETGLPKDNPFGDAKWISCACDVAKNGEDVGLSSFRKCIEVKENLLSARLYSSGLGVYESYIEGERVGRRLEDGSAVYEELTPGFTEAAVRRFYNTYDVTEWLKAGENVLSAVVSPGWWSDAVAAHYGKEEAYLAKLVLRYADGSCVFVDTDSTWKAERASAVRYADIYSGESYDARVSDDWKRRDFDDRAWKAVKINTEFQGVICPFEGSPITLRKDLTRTPKSVTIYQGASGEDETKYGKIQVLRTLFEGSFTLYPGERALVDFGQNFAGYEGIKVEGVRGTTLCIRHGEMLNDRDGQKSRGNDGPEGSIYNANYRSAKATTQYILKGCGVESYHPTFTFYGFRYIEIETDQPVTIHDIKGLVVTSVEKETGFLETSEQDVNKLLSNIRWGQYSNYLSVPTDCPQRDERQGWTADTQVFTKAGCYLAFSKSFLAKFIGDMRDSQREDGAIPGTAPTGSYHGGDWGGTGWADAIVIVPYQLYRFYGDVSIIIKNWDAMQRYVDGFLGATEKCGPRVVWGDWLAYESNDEEIQKMLGVAFYAWDAKMMAEMATACGKTEDARKYRKLYEQEKSFFISLYVGEDGRLKRGEQSVCAYALFLELLPDEESVRTVEGQLVDNILRNGNRLQTGFLGTAILLPTLTKIGRSDLAYSVLLQHENPSWLYSVDQGATTIWERWNSYTIQDGFGDVGMNSFNHYAYGAVAAWMFETAAGIAQSAEGFKRIRIEPHLDERLTVRASYDSAYGKISAESACTKDGWTYCCTLPANTTAEIILPATQSQSCKVNGKEMDSLQAEEDGILFTGRERDKILFEAVSGSYQFKISK